MRGFLIFLGVIALGASASLAGGTGMVKIRPDELPPDTKYPHGMSIKISPPWEQEGEWVLRSPETIGSNHGLLFIDHFRPDMLTVANPSHELKWRTRADGSLHYTCRLDNGVRFSVLMRPGKNDVSILSTFTNGFRHDLSNMGNQYCLIQRGVNGFEDPMAERSYILVNGKFMPLNKTKPGLPRGSKPFFIVTNTRDLPQLDKVNIERSWWCDEQADIPLIATVSEDGKRVVGLAFDNSYKIMTNAEIPCIHADPMYPDCRQNDTVMIKGMVYFVEGSLNDLLPLFYRDFPEWRYR